MASEAATPRIIGLGGVARVGKDTFCNEIISEFKKHGINATRLAFADQLKKDLEKFLLDKAGVNVYTDDDCQKKIIRPLLVEYGKLMRQISAGKYWIDKLRPLIDLNISKNITSIITDVRYPNETEWINSLPQSLTVHMQRKGMTPANEEERRNDPLAQNLSDIILNWETCPQEKIENLAKKHIHEKILQPVK